jgi:hypothetical protein
VANTGILPCQDVQDAQPHRVRERSEKLRLYLVPVLGLSSHIPFSEYSEYCIY